MGIDMNQNFKDLESLLAELRPAPGEKAASAWPIPATSHPTGSLPDTGVPLREGDRARENDSDAAKVNGPAGGGSGKGEGGRSGMDSPAYKPSEADQSPELKLKTAPVYGTPSSVNEGGDKFAAALRDTESLLGQITVPAKTAGAASGEIHDPKTAAYLEAMRRHPELAEAGYNDARTAVELLLTARDEQIKQAAEAESISREVHEQLIRSAYEHAEAFDAAMTALETGAAKSAADEEAADEEAAALAAAAADPAAMVSGDADSEEAGGGEEDEILDMVIDHLMAEGMSPEEILELVSEHLS